MALTRKESFTFKWQIENFSMCPHRLGEQLNSLAFRIDFLNQTDWKIRVYPRGNKKENHLGCYLERTRDSAEDMTIGYTIALISVNTGQDIKRTAHQTFENFKCYGYGEFCSLEDLFNKDKGMLSNDTLNVKCEIWRIDDEVKNTELVGASDSTGTSNTNSNDDSKSHQHSVLTRAKVRSRSVLWPIKRLSVLQPNIKLSKTVASAAEDEVSFDLTFYINEGTEQNINLEIRTTDESGKKRAIFVRGKIKTLGSPKTIQHHMEGEFYFPGGDETWRFPMFIKRKELMDETYLYYTEDVLYLYCEFFYSIHGEMHNFEHSFTEPVYHSESINSQWSKDKFRQLYKDGTFSDVSLRVGATMFRVHKNILSASSSVFRAMFESDMREKECGIVDIVDFDPGTVDRLLMFIYTDELDDINQEDAVKLYSVADKYDVVPLKCRCCCILMSILCTSSVCEVLALADAHQDEDLLEAVRGFIHMNANEVFQSKNWKDFMQSNGQLAINTAIHILNEKFLI